MFERIKNRWRHKADTYDDDMFLSKDWFLSMFIGIVFILAIAFLYLFFSWLIN